MTDLILSCKSKTNNTIKGKTKGHVLIVVIDLFCLMFYFGFVFYCDGLNGCGSRSLSNHNDDDSENNFDRIDVLWSPTSQFATFSKKQILRRER